MMEHIECIPDCYKASKIKIIAQSCTVTVFIDYII